MLVNQEEGAVVRVVVEGDLVVVMVEDFVAVQFAAVGVEERHRFHLPLAQYLGLIESLRVGLLV